MRARIAAAFFCSAVAITVASSAGAQTIRDGDDFSVDVSPAEGRLCVTFPESMKDERACTGVETVPASSFETPGTKLIAVAWEVVGELRVVLTLSKTGALDGPVRPSAITDVLHGAALSIQATPGAKIKDTQHGPIDARPPNAPNAWWRVDASVGEATISSLGHVFYGKQSTYAVNVLSPRADVAHAVAWKDTVVPTVRVRAPAPFSDVEEDKDPNVVLGRTIGGGLVAVVVLGFVVIALRKRKPRPEDYWRGRPPHQ